MVGDKDVCSYSFLIQRYGTGYCALFTSVIISGIILRTAREGSTFYCHVNNAFLFVIIREMTLFVDQMII